MTSEQRDKIVKLTRKNYELLGNDFKIKDQRELIEYLSESIHPEEHRCLQSAILAHNLYNKDDLTFDDFFEWHGL